VDDDIVITITRGQLSQFAGQPLTDREVAAIVKAWPHSSIPEAFATIAESVTASDNA
jgi:hypothetical protein